MRSLIQELKGDNLCTYFVLPLLRLNKSSFIASNFVNAFLTYDCKNVVVQVYDTTLISRKVFVHPNYVNTIEKENFHYISFKLPTKWLNDARLYRQGLYSRISNEAKDVIRQWSGLLYRQADNQGRQNTDGRLLALVRHETLRLALEQELGIEFDRDNELLERPSEGCFIQL